MTTFAAPRYPAEADPKLGAFLDAFRTCLCGTLAQGGRGVCSGACGCEACCLVPGAGPPPADRCDCACEGEQGQAWVRWVRDDPVRPTGGGAGRQRNCTPLRTAVVVEAGVYRCVTVMGDDGSAPSCEDQQRDAMGLLADRRLLRSAVACCHALKGRDWDLVSLEPTAVKGGCAGITLQFSVEL